MSTPASHIAQGKSRLYHHHLQCYMEHVMSSINNLPSREKFHLMSTVWFVLQEPFASLQKGLKLASWKKLCATLFRFDDEELKWDYMSIRPLMRDPTTYKEQCDKYVAMGWTCTMYGDLAKTKRLTPEPILAYWLAHVAISCMEYLCGQNPNTPPTQDHLLAGWAMKSKQSPWLWRQRMRLSSMGCQQPTWNYHGMEYSFPQGL